MNVACARCGAAVPAGRMGICPRCLLETETAPPTLGGYIELEEEIGRGGMATVHRGRDLRLGRTVAVKLLPLQDGEEATAARRFDREAAALARLNHPNIVSIYDVGEQDGCRYIVMEYVDGASLRSRLPLASDVAVKVALQVCAALTHAHGQGIVHRDIKPDNVLITSAGDAKLADFGIARWLEPAAGSWTVTAPNLAAGTPHYLAPEVLEGAAPSPRTDLYAVGVLLYEMVTGRLPIGQFEPLPGGLGRIVRRALAADPQARHASAAELAQDLAALGAPSSARLDADERAWIHAVALLQAMASAVALWALLLSVTPKVIAANEVMPLVMFVSQPLPDGRVVSLARFETLPVLATLLTFSVAIVAYGALRRHWRQAGVECSAPERPVPTSRWVLVGGVVAFVFFVLAKLVESRSALAGAYFPIIGGLMEVVTLQLLWVSILEAWRTRRPLARESRLWVGFGLALMPPVIEFLTYLVRWQP